MALHLLVFALTGLAVVVVAWFMSPGREGENFPISLVVGVIGALLGGFLAWHYWPTTGGEFNTSAVLPALAGAGLLFWAYRSYVRFEGADE